MKILDEFKELVGISSPTGDKRRMADTLKQKLFEIGCEVQEDDAGRALGGTAGNIIARLRGEGGRQVLLSAHMDRVPNGDGIICRVDGNRIVSAGDTILAAELRAMGITPVIEGGGGGMDANRLNASSIRCVGVATGYRFNHSTREELFIDDLVLAGELVERLVMAYAKA